MEGEIEGRREGRRNLAICKLYVLIIKKTYLGLKRNKTCFWYKEYLYCLSID